MNSRFPIGNFTYANFNKVHLFASHITSTFAHKEKISPWCVLSISWAQEIQNIGKSFEYWGWSYIQYSYWIKCYAGKICKFNIDLDQVWFGKFAYFYSNLFPFKFWNVWTFIIQRLTKNAERFNILFYAREDLHK